MTVCLLRLAIRSSVAGCIGGLGLLNMIHGDFDHDWNEMRMWSLQYWKGLFGAGWTAAIIILPDPLSVKTPLALSARPSVIIFVNSARSFCLTDWSRCVRFVRLRSSWWRFRLTREAEMAMECDASHCTVNSGKGVRFHWCFSVTDRVACGLRSWAEYWNTSQSSISSLMWQSLLVHSLD